FGTACCPSNIARLVSSIGNYIYSYSANAIWVNLFIGSNTTISLQKNQVSLAMQSGLPWKGEVKLRVSPRKRQAFALRLRIPGWLQQPVPGSLYRYADNKTLQPSITVNDEPVE